VYSIVGSCNLNGRSDGRDTEAVVAIRDDATAVALEDRFAVGLKNATPVTEADLRNTSTLGDVKEWALSTLAWTI
jgi:phosphatidylserine/phosphatidylglycerophosphate/cardiolipin synthase-like enzyme